MAARDIIIKDTHRGLWYEDGRLIKILEAGRYKLPARLAVRLLQAICKRS
jgi:hypothetical protein